MSEQAHGQLTRFDAMTRELQEHVDQGEVGLAAARVAVEKMRARGDAPERIALLVEKIVQLEFNVHMLRGLIKENEVSRSSLLALLNADLAINPPTA